MPLSQLLPYLTQQRGLQANIPCAACGKSIVIEEGVIEGTDAAAYVVCDFCSNYINPDGTINWNAIVQAYGAIANNAINPDDTNQWNSTSLQYPWV